MVERHCVTLRQEAQAVSDAMTGAGRLEDISDRALLKAAAHKLKGSSGSLGFLDVSQCAERLEHTVRDLENAQLDNRQVNEVVAAHDDLQSVIAEIAPEKSALYKRFAG